ncbi:hypothetical protein [Flavivirga eckloniae]|uniref:Uncharacterized protein n=1 Tax=Flavivirga eckloniae TaxID=1803846 RepID=A0A2K9PRV5_9FLAO|nr:hypothetical protein [Flavivirga eckloniae]AUP79785.1 hypothetical protein C1H87_14160 [Flavivirga eckloniae]
MKKEFIIKRTPLQKIVLNKSNFEIINDQYKEESGIFLYSKLYDIEFREKSIDLPNTVAFSLLSIFLPGRTSGIMKYRERIRMNYNGKERKFPLFDFDKGVVMEAIAEIKKHIDPKYTNNKETFNSPV